MYARSPNLEKLIFIVTRNHLHDLGPMSSKTWFSYVRFLDNTGSSLYLETVYMKKVLQLECF